VLSRACCRQIDSDDTVPLRRTFLRCTLEAIERVENAYSRETDRLEDAEELCFQQSTGDSISPEVDISKGAVGQDFADYDVGDLHATATFQYSCDLADSPCLVRHKVEHAVRYHDIDRRVSVATSRSMGHVSAIGCLQHENPLIHSWQNQIHFRRPTRKIAGAGDSEPDLHDEPVSQANRRA
jgi:hypothetical protein